MSFILTPNHYYCSCYTSVNQSPKPSISSHQQQQWQHSPFYSRICSSCDFPVAFLCDTHSLIPPPKPPLLCVHRPKRWTCTSFQMIPAWNSMSSHCTKIKVNGGAKGEFVQLMLCRGFIGGGCCVYILVWETKAGKADSETQAAWRDFHTNQLPVDHHSYAGFPLHTFFSLSLPNRRRFSRSLFLFTPPLLFFSFL